MSQDHSAADMLSAADPALTITEEELIRSRQRSLSFVNSCLLYTSPSPRD